MIFSGDAPLQAIGPNGIPTNKLGQPYPTVLDPRTGQPVPFPSGLLVIVPRNQRTPYTTQDRAKFITEWHNQGYPRAPNNWDSADTELHHIKPRERGGDNDFWNLVPLPPQVHRLFTDWWRSY
jgi:5-methylcytosine-specific restriction endonuclease McrA